MINIKENIAPLTLIFLGLQGAGKGTQVNEFLNKLQFKHIDAGALFRKMLKEKKGPWKELKVIEKGMIVKTSITNSIVDKEISKVKRNGNLLFDGYPRTLSQAYALNRSISKIGRLESYKAIYLTIKKRTALERLLNRWICPKCQMIYGSSKGKCLKCGIKLEKRVDDNKEYILNRFKYVSKDLDKIRNYYKKKGRLIEVNAEQPIKDVHLEIIRKIGL